jgi:hypothetical protein
MEKYAARIRGARIAVRVSTEDQREIEAAAKVRGYACPSSFIRTAIRNELHGRKELVGIEGKIAGSLERLSDESLRLSRAVPDSPLTSSRSAVSQPPTVPSNGRQAVTLQ